MIANVPEPADTRLAPEPEEELLDRAAGEEILGRLLADEMGGLPTDLMRHFRRGEEIRHRRAHPEEGLRDRKRRLTRQLISDVATTLFATRGFDNVRVSEIAERVGLSEKTLYNYFPTKESLVLDDADERVEQLAAALRERAPGQSPTDAVVAAIKDGLDDLIDLPEELLAFLPLFAAMIHSTPPLRAAWLELHDRLATVAADELAAQAGVDPTDPEPTVAGRALAGLAELTMDATVRHIRENLRGGDLRAAVDGDLDRAARLLETGLSSFNVAPRGRGARSQALEAARAAEEARTQVLKALSQARAAWEEVRREARAAADDIRTAQRQSHQTAHRAAKEVDAGVRDVRKELHEAAREVRKEIQAAARDARRRKR
jgi:AcrR family transcriptional regulator